MLLSLVGYIFQRQDCFFICKSSSSCIFLRLWCIYCTYVDKHIDARTTGACNISWGVLDDLLKIVQCANKNRFSYWHACGGTQFLKWHGKNAIQISNSPSIKFIRNQTKFLTPSARKYSAWNLSQNPWNLPFISLNSLDVFDLERVDILMSNNRSESSWPGRTQAIHPILGGGVDG